MRHNRLVDQFLSRHPGRSLELPGARMHFIEEGRGEPVVMLHGNPTWSFFFRGLIDELAAASRYRLIVPDHIGCGLSDKPDDAHYSYRLDRRVSDLESLLDHLEARERLTLVLHDWGGMIGMAFAAKHPDRIARLVVMNTAAFHMPKQRSFHWQLRLTRGTPLSPLLVQGLNGFCRAAAWTCCTRHPMNRELRDAYCAPYDNWVNRRAVLRFVQDIPLRPEDPSYALVTDTEAALERLAQVPLLVAWGMRDYIFDQSFLEEWRRRFPKAEYHRFETAGHYLLEDAGDEVIPLISRFLLDHPLSVPVQNHATGPVD